MRKRVIIFACFVLIIVLFLRLKLFYQAQTSFRDGQKVTIVTQLLTEPQVNGLTQQFRISPSFAEAVLVRTARFPSYHYGETLKISGTIKKKLLSNKKVIPTMYFPQIEAKQESFFLPLSLISSLRNKLIIIFSSFLPPASSGLLLGIVFGIRDTMPLDFRNALRISGVMHITAASGMNVTMVAALMMTLFALFLPRKSALLFSSLAVWFYALLSGFEASIVRASLMASTLFLASFFGRQYTSLVSLCMAGYLMLFISPLLLFDIGFQLSFASTVSIILLSWLPNKKQKMKVKEKQSFSGKLVGFLAQDMRVTLASQVATLPLLLGYFGQYSLVSLPANLFILWTVPPLMILGALAAVCGLFYLPLAGFVLYVSLPLLLYVEAVISFFATHTIAFRIAALPPEAIIGYYLIIFGIVYAIIARKT